MRVMGYGYRSLVTMSNLPLSIACGALQWPCANRQGWGPAKLGCDFAVVDICFFVVAADVVDFSVTPFVENGIDCCAVVANMQPVSHLHAVTIDRKVFFFKAVVDDKGDQFFRELIGVVIVAASCDIGGQAKCLAVGADNHIGARLGGAIRAIGHKWHGLDKFSSCPQSTIDFI